jgi:hypothetical protein
MLDVWGTETLGSRNNACDSQAEVLVSNFVRDNYPGLDLP